MKLRQLPVVGVFLFLLILALRPEAAKAGAVSGLQLCGAILIPSLFPFSVCAGILVRMGFGERPGRRMGAMMRRLFRLPGEAALPLLLGFLGGYPLGAQILADQVRAGILSRDDGVRLSAFCCNAGPGFLLGAVGTGVLGSARLSVVLLLIHVTSALTSGFLLRGGGSPVLRRAISRRDFLPFSAALPEAVTAAAEGMLRLTGTVVLFSVGNRLLLDPISVLPIWAKALIRGSLELSGGILSLQTAARPVAFLISAVLLGWGGFCVHMQSALYFRSAGLPMRRYLFGKALQALISGILALAYFTLPGSPARLAPRFRTAAFAFFLIFLLLFSFFRKIHWKKGKSVL